MTATKASALGVIPFAMRSEVLEKFEDFKQEECNWIEMAIESEAISLVGAKLIDTECSMMEHVNVDNARYSFYLIMSKYGSNVHLALSPLN